MRPTSKPSSTSQTKDLKPHQQVLSLIVMQSASIIYFRVSGSTSASASSLSFSSFTSLDI